jgi:hypothetical protein
MMQQQTKLVAKFDTDGDQRLNVEERKAAREYLTQQRGNRGPGGPGGPGGRRGRFGPPGEDQSPPQPGPKVSPADVPPVADTPLYDPLTLRTIFLEFESADWEKELIAFKNTDVEVPAKLVVDGKSYPDVGVHFRGMSSFGVGEGRKRSLNLSLDFVHKDQQLGGYRTLNLLNSHEDPTFLRTVLYYHIASNYLPAPKANFVRLVINGESWGVYVNVQQFNKDFVKEWYGTTKGARWKVPGSPGGRGGLTYLGEDPASYKRIYEIKTKDVPAAWEGLIRLCKVLSETPLDELEKALAPLLDIDGALKFLALENALINNDGYWVRASDYYLYQDKTGRFHVLPYDANETFSGAGGPGFPGGPGGRGPGMGPGRRFGPAFEDAPAAGPQPAVDTPPEPRLAAAARSGGVELDPLTGLNDTSKPLRSKLLAVPSLRARYLGYVREIAEQWLDWNKLGPLALQDAALIATELKADTRKLYSTEAAWKGIAEHFPGTAETGRFGPGPRMSLKSFAEKRRAYLLAHPELKKTGTY